MMQYTRNRNFSVSPARLLHLLGFSSLLALLLLLKGCGDADIGRDATVDDEEAHSATDLPHQGRADRIFLGDHILTLDERYPDATAIAIGGGKILWVGQREEAGQWQTESTIISTLGDKTLLPGFIDAHGHLSFTAQTINFANVASPPVGPVGTVKALQNVLRSYIEAGEFKPDDWIIGMGYDDSLLEEQRHPNRDDLDAVTRLHPLALVHVSGHLAAVNSLALKKLGISSQSPNPDGGIIRRRQGTQEPNGVLEETAARSVQAYVFAPSKNPAADMKRALATYASYGITTVQDGASSLQIYQTLNTLAEQQPLDLDVVLYILANGAVPEGASVIPEGVDTRTYTNRIKLAGIKLVLDGSPQGKTAYLSEPYLIVPAGLKKDYRGYPTLNQQTVNARIAQYLSAGVQILAHANGDAAAEMLIDAVALAEKNNSLGDHRTVMIHAQTVRDDQLDRMKKLGIIPSFFSAHTYYWGDWHRDSVLGEKRASRISPAHSTLERDMKFTIHNDTPIVPPDMMRLIWATVHRITRSGRVLGETQRIDVLEAIRATTANAAYQYFEEDSKGSLSPGKIADLVILSDDPTAIDPEEIINVRVMETISHGKTIYEDL